MSPTHGSDEAPSAGAAPGDVDGSRRSWRRRRPASQASYLDRFGLLLTLTALAVVAQSLIDLSEIRSGVGQRIAAVAITALVGTTLVVALRASGVMRRWRLVGESALGVSLGIAVLALVVELVAPGRLDVDPYEQGPVLWLALSLAAPVVTARRLLSHRTVTISTLQAAISAYLLIALAGFYAFDTVDAFQSRPFFGAEEPTTSFMYFSLTTITTLGYGDLSPVAPFGRLLATSEAVLGQVYLVTVVAMVVAMLTERWHRPGPDVEQPADEPTGPGARTET